MQSFLRGAEQYTGLMRSVYVSTNKVNIADFALDFFLHGAIICTYFNDVYNNSCYEAITTDDVLVCCAL
jgi:hypothetical protein